MVVAAVNLLLNLSIVFVEISREEDGDKTINSFHKSLALAPFARGSGSTYSWLSCLPPHQSETQDTNGRLCG